MHAMLGAWCGNGGVYFKLRTHNLIQTGASYAAIADWLRQQFLCMSDFVGTLIASNFIFSRKTNAINLIPCLLWKWLLCCVTWDNEWNKSEKTWNFQLRFHPVIVGVYSTMTWMRMNAIYTRRMYLFLYIYIYMVYIYE